VSDKSFKELFEAAEKTPGYWKEAYELEKYELKRLRGDFERMAKSLEGEGGRSISQTWVIDRIRNILGVGR